MSSYEQLRRLSPSPFYHHSPPKDEAPSTSLSFMLGPPRTQGHQQTNLGPPSSTKQPDDMYYIAKYKEMKRKVKAIELDNDRLHLKCLKARKNIQRLRLERAVLYETLSTMPVAELNVSLVASSQLPGHPYPSPDLAQGHQGRYQQLLYSSDDQARNRPNQARMPSEAVHHPRSYHHPPIQQVDSHRPHRKLYDNPPPIDYQPRDLLSGDAHPVNKDKQRKSKTDIPGEKNQPILSNTHHEVRNGGSRTFPFVHEYSGAQEQVESAFAPQEYPSEIRFHQYEATSERRPVHRSRRDTDRDTEKGTKHRRRPPQEVEKNRQRHPASRSCSPTGPSLHGTYAFPIQNPFISAERESQPRRAQGDERDQDSKTQPVVHFDESSQHSAVCGTREGDERPIRHEHQAEAEGKKFRDGPWQPTLTKKIRVHSHADDEDRYARERNERDEYNRTQRSNPRGPVRADDHEYSLPRVREGEVMD